MTASGKRNEGRTEEAVDPRELDRLELALEAVLSGSAAGAGAPSGDASAEDSALRSAREASSQDEPELEDLELEDQETVRLRNFLGAVRSLDAGLHERFDRSQSAFRFRLRSELLQQGRLAPVGRFGPRTTLRRGLVLAFEYMRLRLRESTALRVAAVLLFVHLIAVPVTACFVHFQNIRRQVDHGELVWTPSPPPPQSELVEEEIVTEVPPVEENPELELFDSRK